MTVTPAQLEDILIDTVLHVYPDADVTYGDTRIVRGDVPDVLATIQYPDERVTFRVGYSAYGRPFVEYFTTDGYGLRSVVVDGVSCLPKAIFQYELDYLRGLGDEPTGKPLQITREEPV